MPLMRATVEQRLAQLASSSSSSSSSPEADAPAVAALGRLLASGDVAARLERAREALGLERGELGVDAAARAPGGGSSSAVSAAAADLLALFGGGGDRARGSNGGGGGGGGDDRDPWLSRAREHGDAPLFDEVLPRLAAIYLALERRRGLALDPVAAFHLRNGAVAWRVAALADRARPDGLAASFGVMATYLYELDKVNERNRRYLVEREVATGPMVEELLLMLR
jgi:hypothetical protein